MNGSELSSINGSKSALYQEHVTFTDRSKSKLVKYLLALVVLFAITTAVFLGLFTYYYGKYDERSSIVYPEVGDTGAQGATTTTTASPLQICNSPDCIEAAAAMIKKMNRHADPCEDFHEYACGRFIAENNIPDGKTRLSTFSVLGDVNREIQRTIVEEDTKTSDPRYLVNLKNLYKSCMDEAQIEVVGLTPYLNDNEYVQDWPTLNSAWDSSSFVLKDVIAKYEKVYIEPIYTYYVSLDMKNSERKVVYLSDGNLGLSQEYFSKPRNDSVIMAYEKYLAEVAKELGADPVVAEQDAKDVVDFEKALSAVMVPREERRDSSKLYNPTNLTHLENDYPELGIPAALRSAFDTANVTLEDNQFVINQFPTYMGNITLVTQAFNNRVIQNVFGFKYALSRVGSLTKRLREIRLDFDRVYSGKTAESPRWETCIDDASSVFWKGMSKEFVLRTFSEQAKEYMLQMIGNLKQSFKSMVDEITWMGEATKVQADEKVDAMKQKIGYPDTNFGVDDINQYYENYSMVADNLYENQVQIRRLSNIRGLADLTKPVDKTEWRMAPYVVNAYFARAENDIVFPAGILQPPFFSLNFMDAANYGGIGVVIGHEITHGFDDQGSQYDKDGNLNNWWEESDREQFLDRAQCIIDQYGSFQVPEVNLTLNGINTQGESIADNGGLKESFRAYKEKQMVDGEQELLPGLDLTNDQVFFLAYSQVWCDKMTDSRKVNQILNGVHPLGQFRIIGPLQNSPDFAKAYNCKAGSYMNPIKKCEVW